MTRDKTKEGLTHLGEKQSKIISNYDPNLLEKFENRQLRRDYWISLDCFEFSTLCPITNQPDFGKILINYVPDKYLVESKSLKLYLSSFRNHGDFSEDIVNLILNDLDNLLQPKYIEVRGNFNARGGISINPFVNHGKDEAWKKFAEKRFLDYQLYKIE
ncbi:MAG: NADPH-dependent 7-cyano-7-deazaguanine reductase QueF [Candidatus Lokiarchaeota archaeon]|nr:NADPH-dependent 7-cyano-7-deazaguanine reductase QueF [Candidatus Lokiarchaeota archaeon]